MEKIHTSHSKSELCEICEIFDINIAEYKKLNKTNLAKQLLYQLSIIEEIKEDKDYYFVKNKKELMDYLVNPDSSKTLTVKQKEEIMELAKYIIMYCNNGFYLSHSPFLDYDEMVKKAEHIAGYGDIPSVRKAIEGLNGDTKLKNKIEIIMSSRMKKKMERKKRLKTKYHGGLIVKKGKFVVSFN
tara:strand:+ start:1034 stop:1588 length:555 start_codon:yes stop_codon:yes gene_type:complete